MDRWKMSGGLEGNGHDLNDFIFLHLTGGTEENHKKLRITDVPASIRTEHLSNTLSLGQPIPYIYFIIWLQFYLDLYIISVV
jgi:hypothetical protein